MTIVWFRLVDVPTAVRDQQNGEVAHLPLTEFPHRITTQPAPGVDPEARRSVDQEVADLVGGKGRERSQHGTVDGRERGTLVGIGDTMAPAP